MISTSFLLIFYLYFLYLVNTAVWMFNLGRVSIQFSSRLFYLLPNNGAIMGPMAAIATLTPHVAGHLASQISAATVHCPTASKFPAAPAAQVALSARQPFSQGTTQLQRGAQTPWHWLLKSAHERIPGTSMQLL